MKLPAEVRIATGQKGSESVMEAIVRDCAEECRRSMYHGEIKIQTINAANHALSDCYKSILRRYGLKEKP